ncbi:hypothetical protein P6709_19515 [Jeotgalibacillus sp. ET6]|uniref:hypothetical protein n=1 Tax=Jeotgalibacillus sp. ET6 TaxID=3037260 RepID=UPI0024189AA9|nr:hypothetical protein [Jeotgalibacillus sp. ET6]MDG5473919.1 hypothetical protein [Jeotgalibacillus sp. ET6]
MKDKFLKEKKFIKIHGKNLDLEKYTLELKKRLEKSKDEPIQEIYYPKGPVYNSQSPRVQEVLKKIKGIL